MRWSTTLESLGVGVASTAKGPIEHAVGGNGPAVLVVHGIPGSWRQGVPLAEDLADAFRVVLPSRPGYGATPLSVGRTYEEQAGAYAALLDTLGIGKVAVVGVSGGGPSALAFASRHPDRTTALVQVCALVGKLMPIPRSYRLFDVPFLAELLSLVTRAAGRRRMRKPGAIDAELEKSLTPDELARSKADPRIRSDLVRHVLSHQEAPAGIGGLRNDYRQVQNAHRSPATYEVRCPTLVLHGDRDTVVGLEHAEHHAKTIPGSQLVVYEDAGHVFVLTRRRETTAQIRDFLTAASRSLEEDRAQ